MQHEPPAPDRLTPVRKPGAHHHRPTRLLQLRHALCPKVGEELFLHQCPQRPQRRVRCRQVFAAPVQHAGRKWLQAQRLQLDDRNAFRGKVTLQGCRRCLRRS